ncbi:MAG: hypothetical protein JJV89_03055 [Desulfosarcina sp.]|nr:hypothetical protein [Desulfobacterales bacterium]
MIIYNEKYNWSGKKNTFRPITWWPGSYWLTIIDTSKGSPRVYSIKPIIVLLSDTGEGYSAKNYFQNLAKSVSMDFNLNISKVLWIEYHSPLSTEPAQMEVAMFKPLTKIGNETFYSVTWRPVRPNEIEELKKFWTDIRTLPENRLNS